MHFLVIPKTISVRHKILWSRVTYYPPLYEVLLSFWSLAFKLTRKTWFNNLPNLGIENHG